MGVDSAVSDAFENRPRTTHNVLQTVYAKSQLVWILAIIASIALQASASAQMSDHWASVLDRSELGFTLAFDVEIVIRLLALLPAWRNFFRSERNLLDTILAVITSVIQIPVVKQSNAYAWLTVFQIGRFYRVILAIPRMRRLLVRGRRHYGTLIGADTSLWIRLRSRQHARVPPDDQPRRQPLRAPAHVAELG